MDQSASTVLVVDDTEENTDILGYLVQSMKHTPVIAMNGKQALQQLEQQQIDLVLLDIMMPDMDGLEVLRRIREQYDLQQLPVILLSALAEVKNIVKGIEAGANDYITKPFNTRVVQVRINSQLQVKRMWDERQRMLNALQHANATKNRLMQIASHDLKNPVSNLNMIISLLEPAIDPTPENRDLLNMAYRYTEEMTEIISEFLDLDILRDEVIEIETTPLAMDSLVMDVVKDYQHAAAKKDVVVQTHLHPVTVLADDKRLRQVVANLVSNAIKYTPLGTTVHLLSRYDGDCAYLHFRDQGSGIPADEAHMLFQPFGKLSTQPTDGEHSTGLGLWIVKQMMDAQGGQVGLNTDYTDGADFWISVPLV